MKGSLKIKGFFLTTVKNTEKFDLVNKFCRFKLREGKKCESKLKICTKNVREPDLVEL